MERWEYEIVSYPVKEVLDEAAKESGVITCDPRGVCLHKDMPTVTREIFVKLLNDQGNNGWELVETHYKAAGQELICLFKRVSQYKQLQH